jgi:hypothetical protein
MVNDADLPGPAIQPSLRRIFPSLNYLLVMQLPPLVVVCSRQNSATKITKMVMDAGKGSQLHASADDI